MNSATTDQSNQSRSGDIKVQPYCQIRTMQHLIYKENTDEFLLKPLVSKWTWDAEKLFPNYGSQAFQDAITAMEPKEGCSYNATNLLQHLDMLKTQSNHVANSHWFFTMPALMIIRTIVTMVIGFFIYRYGCRKLHPPQVNPPLLVNPTFQATTPPSAAPQSVLMNNIT